MLYPLYPKGIGRGVSSVRRVKEGGGGILLCSAWEIMVMYYIKCVEMWHTPRILGMA